MYHYGGNNPIKYTDPTGEFAIAVPLIPVAVEGLKAAILTTGAVLSGMLLGKLATDIINDNQEESENQKAGSVKQQLESNAQATSPNSMPPDDNPENNEQETKHSAKDAKKLDNKGAEKFAQDKGYNDAHELKKDVLRSQKDTKVGHYDIYNNAKTGESFLINKSGSVIIPIE